MHGPHRLRQYRKGASIILTEQLSGKSTRRYSLLAICYSLLATRISHLASCYSLLAARCSLLVTRYSLLATRVCLSAHAPTLHSGLSIFVWPTLNGLETPCLWSKSPSNHIVYESYFMSVKIYGQIQPY